MAGGQTNQSWWSHLTMAPKDAIFGLQETCRQDPRSPKVNFAIGVYGNDDGTPHVYSIVRKVEKALLDKKLDKEYAGIMGIKSFHKAAIEFVLGKENLVVTKNLYATAQTIAGTGALRFIATFLVKHYPYNKIVYMSDNTWPNHAPIFREAGHQIKHYRYYDPKTGGLDSTGLYEDLKTIPANSILLFQACGHNPTGVDPNLEEWSEISRISKERGHFIIIDNVYQGFASGNVDDDMAGLRLLVADGHLLAICHTFSKNMGLYGERVGTATLLCSSVEERQLVESQMKLIIRPMWSNPPINGARIATELLTNLDYKEEWLKELRVVFEDILKKRQCFYDALVKAGSQRDWSHILKQKGWFCFPGITKDQAERLERDYAIFMTKDGRVPVVALRTKDIEYAAKSINEVMED